MTSSTSRFVALMGMLLLASSSALAQGPTTSDTTGRLIADYDKPGIYPTGITASNVNMSPLAGVELDGIGEDLMNVSFPSSSPVRWTSSRANAGDLSLLMGPAYPDNPFSYPDGDASLPYLNNFQAMGGASTGPINPESLDLTTLAWRVSPNKGALLATTRHNGVDNGYTRAGSSGQSTGEYRGLTYFIEGGQGMGFRMTTGEYRNLNDASDLNTGHAGSAGGRHEASFNVATAYLPYEAGWLGAWVGAGSNGAASYFFRPDSVTAISNVTWTNNVATVQLTGIDSADDGMLFVAPTNSDSDMKIASAYPNGSGGWTTTLRLDDNANTAGTDILSTKNGFQYVYVPYTATNLVGGHVNATDGTMINGGGLENFTLTRTEKGHFALSVFEEDGVTKKTEDSGMLILSVADTMESNSALGSRAMMSYEYDSVSGDFMIDVVELISTTSTNPGADGYGNEFAGVNDNFYFAWIDFENPMTLTPPTPPVLAGDYNGDGMVDLADYTVWRDNLGASAEVLANNADGDTVDEAHYATWKANFGESLPEGTLGTVSSIPEPGSIVMLVVATGIGGMVVRRRQAG